MSAQVQVQPFRRPISGTALIAVLAFAIGAVATVSIDAIFDRSTPVEIATPVTLWDSGRLEAMEGRQLAATVVRPTVVWDRGMLEAMEGRQLAETVRAPFVYDSWMNDPQVHLPGELMRSRF